ncbi:MAG: shikimate kinase [Gammaproteobacteria bacterium]
MIVIEKKLVLIGMPGAGKTTVGHELATRADIPFFDTDAMLSEALHDTVANIIESKGEPYFRHKEALVMQRLLRPFYGVLSTGGGSVMDQNIRPLFKAHGVIYLRATPETLASRLEQTEDRPLLKGAGTLKEKLEETLKQRQPVYEFLADFIVDVDAMTPSQVVEAIAAHFELVLDDAGIIIQTE